MPPRTTKTPPQTPEEAREAFLARRRQIGPVFIEPLSLGTLCILEDLKHPFLVGQNIACDAAGNPVPALDADKNPALDPTTGNPLYVCEPLSMRDTARAILAFHDSGAAGAALAAGAAAHDAQAMALVRGIDPALLPQIVAAVRERLNTGAASVESGAN